MNVEKLFELIRTLPADYAKAKVYISIVDQYGNDVTDSSLLHDIDEFVVDVEDDVIVLRGVREVYPGLTS